MGSMVPFSSSRAEVRIGEGVSSVVGADGGDIVPARLGEPVCGLAVVGALRVAFLDTAVLKAAANPPFVLWALWGAGGDGGVVVAAGVPGAELTLAAPVGAVSGACLSGSGVSPGCLCAGVGLCGQ
jgi:hypothetical protein